MMSTAIPVLTIVIAIILSYYLPGGGQRPVLGLYGIGIAAGGPICYGPIWLGEVHAELITRRRESSGPQLEN